MLRIATALALLIATTASGRAETLVWRLDFNAGAAYQLMSIGDESGPWTGEVVLTRVVFEGYATDGDLDTSNYFFTFDVPVLSDNAWIGLSGSDMGWSGHGPVSYVYETEAHNGVLRDGRFGLQSITCYEEPCNGNGEFIKPAYVELVVEGQRADPIFNSNFDDIW